ncbi:unnamed protein product [Fusarium graminearum]|uniref:Chromosome 1, complete genome n=1 Tax=Gibberella zeae (strain ATCC MYA-4620 / CBS 123657 / FGSC 9075 / NRRL 31084 / PH-1) TaxID=229533 RepID=A0A098DAB1_GIBZE|nr:unnamed protein product [Fusarium graminearum]CEF75898.1 unnamed protein product [Fusarium graminearum]
MSSFQYSALDSEKIRFLALHPGAPQDPLAGTLFIDDLDQDWELPYYEALSYCWGDQSSPDTIILKEQIWSDGGGNLDIGRNLASALRQLRHSKEERIIWCDAICINQQDLAERSSQVRRMSEIYTLANRVIIWLGPETSWSTVAMDTLRWVGKQIRPFEHSVEPQSIYRTLTDTEDPLFRGSDGSLPLSREQWTAIEHLLDLDWHKRLWTYQEVGLADQETCAVRLGCEEMLWTVFKDRLQFVSTFKQGEPSLRSDPVTYSLNVATFTIKANANLMSIAAGGLMLPVLSASLFECSDARDRVFACLGFVEPEVVQAIEVDYTKSAKQVFTSVCLDSLVRHQSLEFLGYCKAPTSPTWVPDLEKAFGTPFFDGNVAPRSIPEASLVEPGVLEVAGVLCDELVGIPRPLPAKSLIQSPVEYLQGVADAVKRLSRSDLLHNDTHFNQLIMAVTYGRVQDHYIEKLGPLSGSLVPSLEDWRNRIRVLIDGDLSDGDGTEQREIDERFMRSVPGGSASRCVKTRKGTFVRVPQGSIEGDLVAVILGLEQPLVLRPGTRSGTYSVIGTCYHPELANGSALLGNDLGDWEGLWDRTSFQAAFCKEGFPVRYTDPRLDGIPLDDGFHERSRVVRGCSTPVWVHEDNEGEYQANDPRMSEEALMKRGVPVKRLKLI